MAQTLTQINKQIADLKKQAEQVRQREVKEVVARIRQAISLYGLTASDLGLTGKSNKPKGNGKKLYRDPATKKTWTGHGRKPNWMVAALDAGRSMEDFRV